MDRFPVPGRCSRHDDEFVRQARTFVLRRRVTAGDPAAEANLWFETPDLYYAYEFYERLAEEPESAMFLEARLLSGQSFETIAEAMCITPGTVKWYEALFFNVADRLRHRDWITRQVLIPALIQVATVPADPFHDQRMVKPFLDGSLKMFAYFGGPHVVDVMLSGFKPGAPALTPDDLNGWFDRQWATTVRRRSTQAAMKFEINRYNVTEVFAVHAKIVELDRADDKGDAGQTAHEKAVKSLLEHIPFAAGADGGEPHRGTLVPAMDEKAFELRDVELLKLASGQAVEGLVDDCPLALPPPRATTPHITREDALN